MVLVLTLFLCLYRTDAELRDTMIKVEESIDAGKLRMKPEVGAWQCLVFCNRRQMYKAKSAAGAAQYSDSPSRASSKSVSCCEGCHGHTAETTRMTRLDLTWPCRSNSLTESACGLLACRWC